MKPAVDVLSMISQSKQNIQKENPETEPELSQKVPDSSTIVDLDDEEEGKSMVDVSMAETDDGDITILGSEITEGEDSFDVLTVEEFNGLKSSQDFKSSQVGSDKEASSKSVSPSKAKLEKEKKLLERQKVEKMKEELRKEKELKKQQKEAERKQREEAKLQLKKEIEQKKELQKKEKEEKERRKQEEKQERERKRIEEKAERDKKKLDEKLEREKKKQEEKDKKEEERLKQEELKRKEEEAKLKQKQKIQISNFFKPKTVKSVNVEKIETVDNDSTQSVFNKTFHDFYVKDGTILYDFKNMAKRHDISMDEIDLAIGLSSQPKPTISSQDSLNWFKLQGEKPEIQQKLSSKEVHEKQLDNTIMTIRFIKFYENFNPYIGTYTKPLNKELLWNPYLPERPIFLDFDDEGDENEEGEGEDIDDLDDDEEEEDDEDEDIDDFLERDATPSSGNPKITGPLIHKISWKSTNEQSYRIEILRQNVEFPIDPKRNYWEVERCGTNVLSPSKIGTSNSPGSTPNQNKKPKSLILDKNDLEIFAKQVNQSDYTIPTMVEILKKHLPAYTKATIENTLKTVAKRMGPKTTERKWVVDDEKLLHLAQT